MNKKTLKDLGYFQIIDVLKGFAQSELGVAMCEKLLPYDDLETAIKEGRRVSQLKRLAKEIKYIPLGEIADIKSAISLAEIENSTLDVESILQIKKNLITTRKLKNLLDALDSNEYPSLVEFYDRLYPAKRLEALISKTIGDDQEILDSASVELMRIRRQLRSKREEIIRSLTKVMHSKNNATVIQEQIITIRNDRYVLIAKPNFSERFKGIIHGGSHSGASCYVEPLSIVEENNKYNLLIKDEKVEELKILKLLTAEIATESEHLSLSLDTLQEFDLLTAKVKLSEALNSSEAELKKSDVGEIDLKNALHPLLLFDSLGAKKGGKAASIAVIPINVKFADNTRGMIISGANSGGKTAALKTLGLLTLMAKAGMHVSADEGSSLIFFDKVYTDIGDDQDILKSMGTFSSHLVNIKNILDNTDRATLVLLDELGTGTNPTAGAALFSAVLDYLLEARCFFVATTHLDKIKHYAYINKYVGTVSVAFNEATLKPEYMLIYNQIGQSNAINLAKQIGMDDRILKNAEKYMSDDELKLSNLLTELAALKADLKKEQEEIAEIKEDALHLREQRKRIVNKLREKRASLVKNKEKEVLGLFYDTKKSLREIIKRHKQKDINAIEAFEEITILKKDAYKRFLIPKKQQLSVEKLRNGDSVFISSLKKTGIILQLDQDKMTALVSIGSLKVDIPASDLKKVDSAVGKAADERIVSIMRDGDDIKHEINVIGKTVDEALPIIDKFLDEAYLSDLHEVTIIHGKGTGRLRKGILRHLKESPAYVAKILQGKSVKSVIESAGVTKIRIKQ